MKRTLMMSMAVASLAGLVGGCSKINETKTIDGYTKEYSDLWSGAKVIFKHNRVLDLDVLLVYEYQGQQLKFTDKSCDGDVDEFCALDCYKRGMPGTEKLFEDADREFGKYKFLLGM